MLKMLVNKIKTGQNHSRQVDMLLPHYKLRLFEFNCVVKLLKEKLEFFNSISLNYWPTLSDKCFIPFMIQLPVSVAFLLFMNQVFQLVIWPTFKWSRMYSPIEYTLNQKSP